MSSLPGLLPDWVEDIDQEISAMLGELPQPRRDEYVLEPAPRELLESMALHRLVKDAGHSPGLSKEEKEERMLTLDAVVAYKRLMLYRLSKEHPDLKRGIRCANLRSDGKLWSRQTRLPL